MPVPSPIDQFIAILRIRQAAARRNLIIAGLFLFVWILAAFIFIIPLFPNLPFVYFFAIMWILSSLSLAFTWSEYNSEKNTIELLNVLKRSAEEQH
jgi:membrane protein implicated in regulation of membrane protease activity